MFSSRVWILCLWLGTESIHWSRAVDLPLPRGGYFAAWHNGGVLVAGGTYWKEGKKIWTDAVHFFDPKQGRWFVRTPLPRPLAYGQMISIGGNAYLLGGCDENTVYRTVFRLQSDGWTRIGELPDSLVYFSAVATGDVIYLLAGSHSLNDLSQGTNRAWALDLRAMTWREIEPVPGPPRMTHAAAVVGKSIYVFGGATQEPGKNLIDLDDVVCFDTERKTWRTAARLPEPTRAGWALAVGPAVYLLGGANEKMLDQVLRYDSVADQYSRTSNLPLPLADTKFFYHNGMIYGAGGEDRARSRFAGTIIGTLVERGKESKSHESEESEESEELRGMR